MRQRDRPKRDGREEKQHESSSDQSSASAPRASNTGTSAAGDPHMDPPDMHADVPPSTSGGLGAPRTETVDERELGQPRGRSRTTFPEVVRRPAPQLKRSNSTNMAASGTLKAHGAGQEYDPVTVANARGEPLFTVKRPLFAFLRVSRISNVNSAAEEAEMRVRLTYLWDCGSAKDAATLESWGFGGQDERSAGEEPPPSDLDLPFDLGLAVRQPDSVFRNARDTKLVAIRIDRPFEGVRPNVVRITTAASAVFSQRFVWIRSFPFDREALVVKLRYNRHRFRLLDPLIAGEGLALGPDAHMLMQEARLPRLAVALDFFRVNGWSMRHLLVRTRNDGDNPVGVQDILPAVGGSDDEDDGSCDCFGRRRRHRRRGLPGGGRPPPRSASHGSVAGSRFAEPKSLADVRGFVKERCRSHDVDDVNDDDDDEKHGGDDDDDEGDGDDGDDDEKHRDGHGDAMAAPPGRQVSGEGVVSHAGQQEDLKPLADSVADTFSERDYFAADKSFFWIPMQRNAKPWIASFVVPLVLILALSATSFAMESATELSDGRLSITLTAFVALTTFRISFSDSLPQRTERTFVDRLFLHALGVVFLVAAYNTATASAFNSRSDRDAFDLWGFVGFVVVAAVLPLLFNKLAKEGVRLPRRYYRYFGVSKRREVPFWLQMYRPTWREVLDRTLREVVRTTGVAVARPDLERIQLRHLLYLACDAQRLRAYLGDAKKNDFRDQMATKYLDLVRDLGFAVNDTADVSMPALDHTIGFYSRGDERGGIAWTSYESTIADLNERAFHTVARQLWDVAGLLTLLIKGLNDSKASFAQAITVGENAKRAFEVTEVLDSDGNMPMYLRLRRLYMLMELQFSYRKVSASDGSGNDCAWRLAQTVINGCQDAMAELSEKMAGAGEHRPASPAAAGAAGGAGRARARSATRTRPPVHSATFTPGASGSQFASGGDGAAAAHPPAHPPNNEAAPAAPHTPLSWDDDPVALGPDELHGHFDDLLYVAYGNIGAIVSNFARVETAALGYLGDAIRRNRAREQWRPLSRNILHVAACHVKMGNHERANRRLRNLLVLMDEHRELLPDEVPAGMTMERLWAEVVDGIALDAADHTLAGDVPDELGGNTESSVDAVRTLRSAAAGLGDAAFTKDERKRWAARAQVLQEVVKRKRRRLPRRRH